MVVDFVTFDNISYLFPQRKPFENRKLKFRAKIKQRDGAHRSCQSFESVKKCVREKLTI